jgi:hypothetical protein
MSLLLQSRRVIPKVDNYYIHNDKATPVLSVIKHSRQGLT